MYWSEVKILISLCFDSELRNSLVRIGYLISPYSCIYLLLPSLCTSRLKNEGYNAHPVQVGHKRWDACGLNMWQMTVPLCARGSIQHTQGWWVASGPSAECSKQISTAPRMYLTPLAHWLYLRLTDVLGRLLHACYTVLHFQTFYPQAHNFFNFKIKQKNYSPYNTATGVKVQIHLLFIPFFWCSYANTCRKQKVCVGYVEVLTCHRFPSFLTYLMDHAEKFWLIARGTDKSSISSTNLRRWLSIYSLVLLCLSQSGEQNSAWWELPGGIF